MLDISVIIGGSVFYPSKFAVSSGLSIAYLFPNGSKLGIALNAIKINCAECNTPVAEVSGGSLIIRSRHHSQRHVTCININELQKSFGIK